MMENKDKFTQNYEQRKQYFLMPVREMGRIWLRAVISNGWATTQSMPMPSCCCWSVRNRVCTKAPLCASCYRLSCATTQPPAAHCLLRGHQQLAAASTVW